MLPWYSVVYHHTTVVYHGNTMVDHSVTMVYHGNFFCWVFKWIPATLHPIPPISRYFSSVFHVDLILVHPLLVKPDNQDILYITMLWHAITVWNCFISNFQLSFKFTARHHRHNHVSHMKPKQVRWENTSLPNTVCYTEIINSTPCQHTCVIVSCTNNCTTSYNQRRQCLVVNWL